MNLFNNEVSIFIDRFERNLNRKIRGVENNNELHSNVSDILYRIRKNISTDQGLVNKEIDLTEESENEYKFNVKDLKGNINEIFDQLGKPYRDGAEFKGKIDAKKVIERREKYKL
jgi:hypothetical protein